MDTSKYLAFWPLPGGAEGHIDSLIKITTYVNDNQPTTSQLIKFFFDTFPSVGSEKVVNSYINTVLKHIGFFNFNSDNITLTDLGKQYLKNPDDEFLFGILDEKIIGFREILIILGKKTLNLDDLHAELLKSLGNGIEWESYRQTLVRAKWLQSMKFITKVKDGYILTESGKALLLKLNGTNSISTEIEHPEIKPIDKPIESIKTTDTIAEATIKELLVSEHDASNPERYEKAIASAFRYLGFNSEHYGKAGRTDVLAIAHLGEEQEYSITIDAKCTASDKIPERQISWDSLNDHKNENNADYIVVVAPGFAGGDLRDRAIKHNVLLIDTKSLIELIKLHSECTLNLLDYKEIFSQTGIFVLNNCDKLLKKFDKIKKLNDLIPKLLIQLGRLHVESETTTVNDIYWALEKAYSKDEILEALKILMTMDMVAMENGQYIAVMSPIVASRKFEVISNIIKR